MTPVETAADFGGSFGTNVVSIAGCSKLKERGVETAVLGTSSKNIGMQQAAKAVGFQVQSTKLWFEKPVSLD